MFNKKLMILAIFFVSLLAVSAVNAVEVNETSDTLAVEKDIVSVCASDVNNVLINSNDDNQIGLTQSDENNIITLTDDNQVIDETNNEELISDTTVGTFANLKNCITSGYGSTVTLENDYEFEGSGFSNGIQISQSITIDGQGHKIDAKEQRGIFKIEHDNVIIKNIVFKNAKDSEGAAICSWYYSNITIINCTFMNCFATEEDGGAIYIRGNDIDNINIVNSTFINCFANNVGGAIAVDGCKKIINCKFRDCHTNHSNAALSLCKNCDVINSTFINCTSKNIGTVSGPSGSNIYNCTFINSQDCIIYNGTVTNSKFINGSGGYAVSIQFGNITNCEFTNCCGPYSAVNPWNSNCYIYNCEFNNCFSNSSGGAFHLNGGHVFNSSFTNCSSNDKGGAIHTQGGTIIDCNFINCYSKLGGAIYCDKVGPDIISSNFTNCSASEYGGAIYNYDKNNTYNTEYKGCNINLCIFNNCSDSSAYAIYNSNGTCIITNSSFSDLNEIEAVYNVTFINCTVGGNGSQIYPNGKTAPVIEISVENIIVGEDAVVNVVLPSDIQDEVTVFVDGDNKIVNLVNGVGHASFPDLGPGIHNVSVVFGGNGDYLNTSNSTHFSVSKKTPSIVIKADNMNPNEFQVIRVLLPNDATGVVNFCLYNGNNSIRNVTSDVSQDFVVYYKDASFNVSDLVIGSYNLTVEYSGDENYSGASDYALFTVSPKITINQEVIKGDNLEMFIDFGVANENMSGGNPSVKGNVRIYIDGEEYASLKVSGNKVNYITSTDDITLGNHTVTFQYVGSTFSEDIFRYGNNKAYVPIEYNVLVSAKEIVIPPKLASNDVGEVVVEMPGDSKGTLDIYLDTGEKITTIDLSKNSNRTSYKETVESVVKDVIIFIEKTEDNRIIITMTFNQRKGNVGVILDYSGDEKYSSFRKVSTASISHKDPLVSAKDLSMVYSSGKVYSVVVYGINGKVAGGVPVRFLINNNLIGNVMTNGKGVASIKITYAPGSYKITASALGVKATKKLTVTHLLTLKTVKVKKSAKKLVLTATLKKVNGKYLKGKRITFKFNGKTYKAKTNKKGVAKVTIKKNVLKKLKKGKKVTYQATYLKDTVKKTVKVKK